MLCPKATRGVPGVRRSIRGGQARCRSGPAGRATLRASRPLYPGDGIPGAGPRLDRRHPSGAGARRHGGVRRRQHRPRGAHRRDSEGVRDRRRAGRARRGRARGRGPGRRGCAVARLPACRRRPADLRGDRRLRRGTPRSGTAPQPGADVPLGPARSEGRRSRRARRPRHRRVRRPEAARRFAGPTAARSFSSCAITATTSCSFRSSGSI